MDKQIKQHYIPRVYLKHWENDNCKVWLYDLSNKTYREANKKSIFYIRHLYSIGLPELYLLDLSEKVKLLEPLEEYHVFWGGAELKKDDVFNHLSDYKDFIIKRDDGTTITKGQKEDLVEKTFNNFNPIIENKYSKIESDWKSVVPYFENIRANILFRRECNLSAEEMKKKLSDLKQFLLSMYTRNPYNFVHSLNRIAEKERNIIDNRTAQKVFKEIQLSFLDNKRKLFNMNKYNVNLFFARPNQAFITCDNPVIIKAIEWIDPKIIGILWFSISPNILVMLSEKSAIEYGEQPFRYYIVENSTICWLNQMIANNSETSFVSKYNIPFNGFTSAQN